MDAMEGWREAGIQSTEEGGNKSEGFGTSNEMVAGVDREQETRRSDGNGDVDMGSSDQVTPERKLHRAGQRNRNVRTVDALLHSFDLSKGHDSRGSKTNKKNRDNRYAPY